MFKYFKKQRSRLNADDEHSHGRGINVDETVTIKRDCVKRSSLRSTSSFCDDLLSQVDTDEDDMDGAASVSLCGKSIVADDDIFKYNSRLAMSLPSIVSESNCLSYFIQYLEMKNGLSLLKFYLDIVNFKTAALSQLEKQKTSLTCFEKREEDYLKEHQTQPGNEFAQFQLKLTDSSLWECAETAIVEESREEQNSVPELKTLYDISMRKPLTDDEKSEIYAETNKQINKCHCSVNQSNNRNKSCSDQSLYFGNRVSVASVNDAITIYKKYLIASSEQFVSLPVTLLSEISLVLCQCSDESTSELSADALTHLIAPTCFDEAQRYVLNKLEGEYLNDFLQSIFFCKYCIELIESSKESLSIFDILYSEVTLFFFMEFLEQHGERECLDFWTAAINFRKSYANTVSTTVESEAQSDAMIIYEKFFSLQSDNRFWVSDKLRSRVEERICAAGHVAYCFDLPLHVVAKYLERKYFSDFLNSQLFSNYLSELKAKVNEEVIGDQGSVLGKLDNEMIHNANTFRRTHKSICEGSCLLKTVSDFSNGNVSELCKPNFQHNTLLAMDATKLPTHLRNLHNTGTKMNIDSQQLTNPNLLWRRSNSTGGLKFGHVNALGRYERDFEVLDMTGGSHMSGKHNWSLSFSGNKIKSTMRKLVNMPEEKMQEEIAWQVAEMIVKDVTSITLNNNQSRTNTTTNNK